MKKVLLVIGVLAAIGIGAFLLLGRNGDEIQYRTDKVSKGDIVASVTATGTMNAVTTVLVGTQVSGTIKKLYVDFNSRVKKGQIIAQIDPALFEAQVEQARANLYSAKANVEKAEETVVDAKRTMLRNKELIGKNLIAQSDYDTSETNYQVDVSQVSAAKAAVAQAEASLKTANTNLDYTRIISPVDGIVVSRNVDVGQTVAASFQTPTLFTIAQDLTKMQIDTSIAEADIGGVKVGQEVDFTVDAYPDITFKGKVWQIRIAPITVQNVVTYDVVVLVDNKQMKLMPGMTANVSVIVDQQKDVLRIPNAALRFKPSGLPKSAAAGKPKAASSEKGPSVWIIENEKPRRIPVKLGISDGSYTEVLSGSLSVGQEVIVESVGKSKAEASGPRGPRMF
jgi:HlyD family secretion protein